MQGMAGLVGFDARQERAADEGEVADQIQSLVPAKFVGKAQGAIHHSAFIQDNGVVERSAANQPHPSQALKILHKAKSSRGRQRSTERFAAHAHLNFLCTYSRVRVLYE